MTLVLAMCDCWKVKGNCVPMKMKCWKQLLQSLEWKLKCLCWNRPNNNLASTNCSSNGWNSFRDPAGILRGKPFFFFLSVSALWSSDTFGSQMSLPVMDLHVLSTSIQTAWRLILVTSAIVFNHHRNSWRRTMPYKPGFVLDDLLGGSCWKLSHWLTSQKPPLFIYLFICVFIYLLD